MNSASRQSKLAELRLKTDQELSQIIANNLQSALNFGLMADSSERVKAEKAYAEALKLLPKVDDLQERRRLETRLEQVRKSLTRLATRESRVQLACS